MTTNTMPMLGLGTFRLQGQTVIDSVRMGLELGYRLIDTAQIYGNEAEIGKAIAASSVPRNELFLTTKIWTEQLSGDKLIASLKESLAKLGSEALDLTLVHWPSPGGAVPLAETLQVLLEAQSMGLTQRIGVSNFTVELLHQAVEIAGPGRIFCNQVELHPYLQNRAVLEFARSQGVGTTSYMTLAYGAALKDEVVQTIAAEQQATPAQVLLAWALQQGIAVIPSSTRRENLASNLLAGELRLTGDQIARLNALERNGRLVNPEGLAPRWD